MKLSIKRRWVKALRSGEYKQGKTFLNQNEKFCCLGVLCDLLKEEMKLEIHKDDELDCISYNDCETVLPNSVMNYTNIKYSTGYFADKDGKSLDLAELNDNGTSFEEIADIIDKHWKVI